MDRCVIAFSVTAENARVIAGPFFAAFALSSDHNKAIGYGFKIQTRDEPSMAAVAQKRELCLLPYL
jgi:hypothetical protein